LDTIEKLIKSHQLKRLSSWKNKFDQDVQTKSTPIDSQTALNRFGGDQELYQEMVEGFLGCAPEQLHKLTEAVKRGEAKEVERGAHSLKGAAGNLGADHITDLSFKLELMARSGDLAEAGDIIAHLKTGLKNLEEYIRKLKTQKISLKSQ